MSYTTCRCVLTSCQETPPLCVTHSPGPYAQPSLALANKILVTPSSGTFPDPFGATPPHGAGGARAFAQCSPPSTVVRSSMMPREAQSFMTTPSSQPSDAEVKEASIGLKVFPARPGTGTQVAVAPVADVRASPAGAVTDAARETLRSGPVAFMPPLGAADPHAVSSASAPTARSGVRFFTTLETTQVRCGCGIRRGFVVRLGQSAALLVQGKCGCEQAEAPWAPGLHPASVDDPPQETSGALVLRIGEELGRRASLDDSAFLEEADPVRDVPREAHLMGGDEHGHPCSSQFPDDVEHLCH